MDHYVDENGWHYDLSEMKLPLDERPHFVTVRAWEDEFGTTASIITNKYLEGLFSKDGSQVVGTMSFSLGTPMQAVDKLRRRLRSAIGTTVVEVATEGAPQTAEAISKEYDHRSSVIDEAEEVGAISYPEAEERRGQLDAWRDEQYRRLAKRVLRERDGQ